MDNTSTGNDPLAAVAPCVARLCRALDNRDYALLAAQLSPRVRWTIVGRPDRFAFGGVREGAQVIESLTAALIPFRRFSFKVQAAAQTGEIAFVEAEVNGEGPGAAVYHNHYLMRLTLEGTLIADVLEHYDPFEALVYVEQLAP